MPYVAANPAKFAGEKVPNGECVAFVKVAAGCPATSAWKQGVKVRGSDAASGTAIAIFENGVYVNISGRSHAAILVSQDDAGLEVWDQWKDHAVSKRKIMFKGGGAPSSNDGDCFSVID